MEIVPRNLLREKFFPDDEQVEDAPQKSGKIEVLEGGTKGDNKSNEVMPLKKEEAVDKNKEVKGEDEGNNKKEPTLQESSSGVKEKPEANIEKKEAKIDKRHFEAFLTMAKKLAFNLRDRNQKRFNSLLSEEDAGTIVQSVRRIEELLDQKEVIVEDVNKQISNIDSAISKIGAIRSGNSVKDSTESLGMIMFGLRQVTEHSQSLRIYISKTGLPQSDKSAELLKRLVENTETKWNFVARKKNALENIYRR